ncbi:Amino acid transporter [Macleaya cordata]|uniref:Amino acid transporter n=1 Tax=Macleaya cordata TaxID=56857 RepID=A0A200R021_MACCD|nr:Amino acid transporter [Macleaya cordata]
MGEVGAAAAGVGEISSLPVTPRSAAMAPLPPPPSASRTTPPISAPPSQFHSPSLSRSPLLLESPIHTSSATPNKTPRSRASLTPRFITPLASPVRKIIKMTKLEPRHDEHDDWLPITESRNGNAYYAAFHTLCSGIGIQALILPVAFTILGWTWGIISLSMAFLWQLYTLWLLVQLHESADGTRYSRYLDLFTAAFGKRVGKLLGAAPIMYLSAGTCIALIIIGGSTMKLIYQVLCGPTCSNPKPLTTVEWYLVFTCIVVVFSQLPNLNSIAGVSLVGAITAVGYCTLLWVVSVAEGRIPGVSYNPIVANSDLARVFGALNALGIIAFAFRGHNLVLEIQGTMPSSEKYPSRVPMWRGVKLAYLVIAMCLFPLAIGGYWAYGHMIPANGGLLDALHDFHEHDTSRFVLGLMTLLIVINSLTTIQIYAMPTFDNLESTYTSKKNKPCPWLVRAGFRVFLGSMAFFIALALPFLGSLAGLIGGIALPITFAYPCFMWIMIKKPQRYGPMWCLNWGLGSLGIVLSLLVVAGGIWSIVLIGVKGNFFKP